MEVINPILVISAALCSGFSAILTGAQNIVVHKYNNQPNQGEDVTLICDFSGNITNCQWYFTQNGGEKKSLTNGTRYTWSCSSISSEWVRSRISLKNVTFSDSGIYTCEGMKATGQDRKEMLLTVLDLPLFNPPNEDLTGSPLEKYVVPGISVFVCVALIALIVVVILIRRKRQKGLTDKPDLEIRSTIGPNHPSPSENIRSGNNHAKFYVHLSGDLTYAQVIRKSSKIIDGNKSISDNNIPQSNTHIDGSNSIRDIDVSQVYMNINNAYGAVQQRSSTLNSNSCINEETESENTQVKKTEELSYVELEFSSNAQDENNSLGIRGSPSDTTYTEVVNFTR